MAALQGQPARAETQIDPIARLSLGGGYDSNVLFDGRSDVYDHVSPEVGLQARDHLWDVAGLYGADFLQYRELRPDGVWNHRGKLDLSATPTERMRVRAGLRFIYATDPVGLAQAGIFRTNEERAFLIQGNARVEYSASHSLILGAALTERAIEFEDGTGGAMHGPSVEALHPLNARLLAGGAFAFTIFDEFQPATGDGMAYAPALRARLRYSVTRFAEADAFAGPAVWSGPDGRSVVPEVGGEFRLTDRDWDLRVTVAHALGLGTTSAAPSLVNSAEVGTIRRFGRAFELRADGGIWQSGDIPTGDNATVGYSVSGQVGWLVTRELRLALVGSYLDRLDDSSPLVRRGTLGIRMGWELPAR